MSVPAAGTVIDDKYELLHEIGRGGMGVVWKAHVRMLEVPCAIKFILPHYAADPAIRVRFLREAKAAAKLRGPHTVSILDVGEWEGYPFIVMEMLEGESLERRLSGGRPLSPQLTAGIIMQVAVGLSKVHAAGMVHRDLKPENIHIVDDSPLQVKILDFGIVKQIDSTSKHRTAAGAVMGTPYYMSPEQAHGQSVDFRADLWSLAMVAYQCLTGRLPFDSESLADLFVNIVSGPIPSPRSVNPALSPAIEAWWLQTASRDPAGRPASALALAESLHRAVAGLHATEPMVMAGTFKPVSSEAPGPPSRGLERRKRSAFLYGVLATGAVVLGALALRAVVNGSDATEASASAAAPEAPVVSTTPAAAPTPAPTPSPAPAPIELSPPSASAPAPKAPVALPPATPPATIAPARTEPARESNSQKTPPRVNAPPAPVQRPTPASPPSYPRKPTSNDRLGI